MSKNMTTWSGAAAGSSFSSQRQQQQPQPYRNQLPPAATPILALNAPSRSPMPSMSSDYGRDEHNNDNTSVADNGADSESGDPFEYLYYPMQSLQRLECQQRNARSLSRLLQGGQEAPPSFQPPPPRENKQQRERTSSLFQPINQQQGGSSSSQSPSHFPFQWKGEWEGEEEESASRRSSVNPVRAGGHAPFLGHGMSMGVQARNQLLWEEYWRQSPLITPEEQRRRQRELDEKAKGFDSDDDDMFYPGDRK
ncbi:hypothetical protein F4820DRAFT_442877 [Hypoxylon rubiginosum]|uniref:Uncharacterized protein n=1 Tax=Hypoxylon rubiginosum TaxID=110542 RepID=A0ACB9ZFS3_9PEZI|nr:hypothetical protein F4820DRAFT_442877 [Hypoxylon rubiginosum]